MAEHDALERLSARVDELLDRVARLEEPLAAPPAARATPASGRSRRSASAPPAATGASCSPAWPTSRAACTTNGRRSTTSRPCATATGAAAAEALRALGHPVRLMLLQAVLGGAHTVRALEALPGLGTTGQIYHHLRELQRAGWLSLARRNHYEVAGERVVPLLVALAAAGLRGGGSR